MIPLSLTLLALATANPAVAIDGGAPDGSGHPNVGLLAFDLDGDGPLPLLGLCTGSVLSDRAFLTAAHCIEAVPASVTWAVSLDAGPVVQGGSYPDAYPLPCCALTQSTTTERATGVTVDQQDDLAVVRFAPGTFATVEPVELPRIGMLDHLASRGNREGPQFTLVGYGAEIKDGGFYIGGYRETARASFAGLEPDWLELVARTGALCFGDSGSPQFLGGSNLEVSLLHDAGALGDPEACRGGSVSQRLDTPSAAEFLQNALQAG